MHWDWDPAGPARPNTNLAGAGGSTFAASGSGRSKNYSVGPGIWHITREESTNEVEK